MQPSLPRGFPEDTIFIIDGLSAAYTVALICAGRSVRCIYECKEIEWRKVDFIALYDLLLADVHIREKRIEYVPHPHFIEGRSILGTILKQRVFISKIRRLVPLDRNEVYCGCVTSSILLGNKDRVRHLLMDEGMDSIMTRHLLYSQGRGKWKDRVRETLKGWLIPFRFHQHTPQITMAGDSHRAIVLRLDYRNFRSHRFQQLARPLIEQLGKSDKNVLVLLNGPPHTSVTPQSDQRTKLERYIAFNVEAIKRFIAFKPEYATASFNLKSHPSLGGTSVLTEAVVGTLARYAIHSKNLWEGVQFQELPSLPAEACLATGRFEVLLSLDASSVLWHVSRARTVTCYMPFDAIVEESRQHAPSALMPLFAGQRELNQLTGNHVIFY